MMPEAPPLVSIGPPAGVRIALDLFCGTGGATSAFREKGWSVIGVDNDSRRAAEVHADVRTWRPSVDRVDFIWASPPCTEFSTARPGSQDRRPSLDLVFATLEIVRDIRPRFWIMENVVGAIPFLGAPLQKIGPFCLWGYFPRIEAPLSVIDHRKFVRDRRTAAARAAIPYDLSEAVRQAVEGAWYAERILDMRQYRRHRHVRLRRDGRQPADVAPGGRPAGETAAELDGQ